METQAELLSYLQRRLGAPTAYVELTDDQINDAIDDAIRLFNHYLYIAKPYLEVSRTGSVTISIPSDATGVLAVYFLESGSARSPLRMNVFEICYRMITPTIPIGEWYMIRSFLEMYRRARGADPDWYYDRSAGTLYCDCVSGPYDIFYICSHDITADAILAGRLRRVKDQFIDATLAYTKERLANVRGKFDNTVPAPGGSLTLDANKLASESRADIEKITSSLQKQASARLLPTWG